MLAETEAVAEAEAALPNDLKNQSRARTDDDARHLCTVLLLSCCCCCWRCLYVAVVAFVKCSAFLAQCTACSINCIDIASIESLSCCLLTLATCHLPALPLRGLPPLFAYAAAAATNTHIYEHFCGRWFLLLSLSAPPSLPLFLSIFLTQLTDLYYWMWTSFATANMWVT